MLAADGATYPSRSRNITSSHCFSIVADEYTDCSNKEQFTINIHWVDQHLTEDEDLVLVHMNTKVADCRGQCYDGTSNMSSARKGVAAIITQEESRAPYTLLLPTQ